MANLLIGSLINSPQECIEFIHAHHSGMKILTSTSNAKLFWSSHQCYREGIEGAQLYLPSTNVISVGTFLAPAVVAATAYFKGVTALELSHYLNSIISSKTVGHDLRYFCGNGQLLLAFEKDGKLEFTIRTPILFEAHIRQLFLMHENQNAAVV
ncbi:MAG: hypothetical protein EOO52_12730 [Gammaproteobacteria bacterium]|nr:MAG: hypothetical protein EOO52_12730 [Gammaproteobacteria bacterium]